MFVKCVMGCDIKTKKEGGRERERERERKRWLFVLLTVLASDKLNGDLLTTFPRKNVLKLLIISIYHSL